MVTATTIKKGYRQTELGVIPEDWDVKKLGEIGSFSKGQGIRIDQSQSGELPCIRYGELYTRHSNYIKQYYSFISKEVAVTAKKLAVGDILFAGSGETKEEIGKCAAFIDGIDAYAGGDVVIFSPYSTDSLFLGYLLNSPITVKQKASKGQGDAVVHISASNLKEVQIPLPATQTEQTAIATVLSDTDTLIEHLEELIAKKQAIKQGTMQQLLTGKKRLSGFSGEWEVKKLGEIANVIGGGTPSTYTPNYWNGMINWFTPTEIGLNKYTYSSLRKITKEGLENCSARILPKGTVLLTTRAGIGDVSILMNEGCTNQGFQSLVANNDVNHEFLYYLVSTLKNVLIQNASGSTFLEISPNRIKQIEVKIPDPAEQTAIATVISDMDAEIERLEQKRDKYTMLKQGMMQQLLTGKIRLL